MTATEKSRQDDYDSPWKEAIKIMLADFMAFYFPDAWRAIDWQQPHHLLDQELQKIVPESSTGRCVVDKLVEVALVQGGDQWIHLHIEIQSSWEVDFAERMMIYHYRIFDRFRRPVASLAVLADNQTGWQPGPYRQSMLGCQWILDFPNAKLLAYRLREKGLAGSDNLFGLVTLAHLRTQGTRNQSGWRYRAKYRLIRLFYGKSWAKSRIFNCYASSTGSWRYRSTWSKACGTASPPSKERSTCNTSPASNASLNRTACSNDKSSC
ncbi:hypothetical protein Y5W_01474 [Alcanivorax sp. 521-1]|uniref:Cytosolic protein n=1 Tax=Alloalcanivorax profundimaris TaxID=2735259 RepID=A0ABS0APW7_9GAMM|nr:hypothetical protein [Alloalcanivorax profundimaris]MBF5056180.1 hypothetical protein [Alloalcanivorax profundimaris]